MQATTKGTEKGLKHSNNTGYICRGAWWLLAPKGNGEDKLKMEHLAYTANH